DDHQQRESDHPRQRQRVDAVSDAAALHQQDTALAAKPGARQNADALLFGGEHSRLYLIGRVAQLDQPRVPRVGNVCDVADVELAQLFEDQVRPILRIGGHDGAGRIVARPSVSPSGHLPSFQTDNRFLRLQVLYSRASEIGLALLGEGRDAFLVVAALAQLLVGVPLDLEACAQTRVVRRVQHSLDRLERKRRHGGERGDDVVENAIERRRVVGNAREQAPAMGFRRGAAAGQHHVHCAGQAGDARDALTTAAAGNLAESHFRERQDRILGRDPDVARHGQFEAYSHRIPFQHANDRLRAALRRGDVPREMGHPVALDLRERLDVAARREHAVFAADHDDAHVRILAECLDDRGDLTAPAIGHDIQRRPIEPEKADLLLRVDVVVQAIEIAQNRGALFGIVLAHESSLTVTLLPSNASYSPVRNLRRKSLPDAERGMAFTNTYSLGRLAGESAAQAHAVELLGCELGDRRFDESHHLGAEPLVRHSHDGASRNELAAREGVLPLLGKDVFAAADNHVVDAADDVELAILVELSEIAGAVPAALDRLGVGVGALPVARECLGAAHAGDNLTGDTRLQVDLDIFVARRRNDADDLVHHGAAGAAGLAVEMIAVAEGVDLAGTVVVDEQIGLELIQAALDQRWRHRHACEAYAGQGTQVIGIELGVSQHVVEHRGHEEERRQPLFGDQP